MPGLWIGCFAPEALVRVFGVRRLAAALFPIPSARPPRSKLKRARYSRSEKWGFIHRQGKVIVEPQFDGVGAFSDGFAQVYVQGRGGYIDQTGGLILFPRFQETAPFSEGLAAVCCEDGTAGYVVKTGVFAVEPTFPPGYGDAGPFSEGVALVRLETGGVYIDRTGKVIAKVSDARK
ncbi:MAG: WG repeat-containing protein [Acidobacteriota bacterium]